MGGTLSHMAKQDFQVFMDLFACDIRELDALTGGAPVWSELASYVPADDGSRVFNKRVRDRIVELAVSTGQGSKNSRRVPEGCNPVLSGVRCGQIWPE